MGSSSALNKLSDDVLFIVVMQLSLQDQVNLFRTCRRLKAIGSTTILWKHNYITAFQTGQLLRSDLNWELLYRHRLHSWYTYEPRKTVYIGKNKCINDADFRIRNTNSGSSYLTVTAGSDGSMRLWNSQSQSHSRSECDVSDVEPVIYMPRHRDPILCCSFLSNNEIVAGSRDGYLRKLDINHFHTPIQETRIFKSTNEGITRIVVCVCGIIAAGTSGSFAVVQHNGEVRELLRAHSDKITGMYYSAKSQVLVSLCRSGMLKIWKWCYKSKRLSCTAEYKLLMAGGEATSMAVINDLVAVSGFLDGSIKLYNIQTGEQRGELRGHSKRVRTLHYNNENLVSGSVDGTIKLWCLSTSHCLRTYTVNEGFSDQIIRVCLRQRKLALITGAECQILSFA